MTQKLIQPGTYRYYKIVLEGANSNVPYCFSLMNQLKKFIKLEFDMYDSLIYKATVYRMIVNIEQVNCQILHTLGEDLFSCLPYNYKAEILNKDSCTIYVVKEKPLYPRDMGEEFEKKGISCFNENDYSSDVPLISEAPDMAVRTSRSPDDFSGNDKYLTPSCSSATPTDIIVDMNLHELYPEKTGKVPQSLKRFFKSGKEPLLPQKLFEKTR